ncbi:hypothetical protein SLA2020_320810 [Shorea laevis]
MVIVLGYNCHCHVGKGKSYDLGFGLSLALAFGNIFLHNRKNPMEVASVSTDEGTLSASQNHLNFTSLGFLFYYESQLLRSICSKSINTHPILPQPLFLPRHLACSIPIGKKE